MDPLRAVGDKSFHHKLHELSRGFLGKILAAISGSENAAFDSVEIKQQAIEQCASER
jgi:hypothetical protein